MTQPDADGDGQTEVQRFAYTARGELEKMWGHTAYPVRYAYDALGRKTEMYTWRETPGVDWTAATWPSSAPAGDKTTWVYDAHTGLLKEKWYAPGPPNGTKTTYTYTVDGKLQTRTWARQVDQQDLITTYAYGTGTGELESVTYSDSTLPTWYTYDRLGRQTLVKQGGTEAEPLNTWTFAPDPASVLRMKTETIAGGLYNKVVTRKFEDGSGETVAGRDAGFQIGITGDLDQDYDVTCAYEPKTTGVGRLNQISGPGLPAYGVEYARLANSDAVEYARYKDAEQGDPLAETHRMYETARDLIDYVENSAGSPSATVSKYDYVNDVLARRTRVDLTGAAFSTTGNHHVQFGYNTRSELTAADRYQGNGTSPPYTHLTQDQHEFDYVYDHIGNRLTYGLDGSAVTYCTNPLNQYTDIGSAITCPPSTPTLAYDLDGNLTADSTFTYEWDAENRLIRVAPASLPAEGDKKCEFAYDYQDRRVQKKVYEFVSGQWSVVSDQRFVYDQWNVVLVLNALESNATRTKYTWGLDLADQFGQRGQSGQRSCGSHRAVGIPGTDGIGGLLSAVEATAPHEGSYWFVYDANANVGQILSASDQSIAARYEYDPYGNTLLATGDYAAANPFRFSTKWFDSETGLYYYGYRYLWRGRWLNRDPIEEEGGANLYEFVLNDPEDIVDTLGDRPITRPSPIEVPWWLQLPWPAKEICTTCDNLASATYDVVAACNNKICDVRDAACQKAKAGCAAAAQKAADVCATATCAAEATATVCMTIVVGQIISTQTKCRDKDKCDVAPPPPPPPRGCVWVPLGPLGGSCFDTGCAARGGYCSIVDRGTPGNYHPTCVCSQAGGN